MKNLSEIDGYINEKSKFSWPGGSYETTRMFNLTEQKDIDQLEKIIAVIGDNLTNKGFKPYEIVDFIRYTASRILKSVPAVGHQSRQLNDL